MASVKTLNGKNGATTPMSHPPHIVISMREISPCDEVVPKKEVTWLA